MARSSPHLRSIAPGGLGMMTFVPTEGPGMWNWTRVSSANDEDPGSSSWLIMRGNHTATMAISPSCGLASLTWNHIVWLKRLDTNEHASAKHHFANFCSVTITITVNNQNSNPILATTSKQTCSRPGTQWFWSPPKSEANNAALVATVTP